MPLSRMVLAATLALVALPQSSASAGYAHGPAFTVGDLEFNHEWLTAATMPTARSDLTATTVGDAVYLIGGCSNNQEWSAGANMYLCSGLTTKTEKFLPLSKTWDENIVDAPRTRYRHAAVVVATRIYLLGGRDVADGLVHEIDVLDTATGTWSTLQDPMPNVTSDLAAFEHGEKIYVVGGYTGAYDASAAMMVFNPLESGNAAWSTAPALNMGRGDTFAVVAANKAYVVGGFHHSNWEAPMASVEMFDLALPSAGWKVQAKMTLARGDKAVTVLHDLIHVAGGETKNAAGHSVPVMDVEAYDTKNDIWYPGGSIPSHRFRFVAASHGHSIFLFGGQGALVGGHGAAGSKYPVLDLVEEYYETVSVVAIGAASAQQTADWIAVAVALSILLLQL